MRHGSLLTRFSILLAHFAICAEFQNWNRKSWKFQVYTGFSAASKAKIEEAIWKMKMTPLKHKRSLKITKCSVIPENSHRTFDAAIVFHTFPCRKWTGEKNFGRFSQEYRVSAAQRKWTPFSPKWPPRIHFPAGFWSVFGFSHVFKRKSCGKCVKN